MGTHRDGGAAAPRLDTPSSDNAWRQPGFEGLEGEADSGESRCSNLCARAALTIEGEAYARAYLDRLHADAVQPGELAVLLSFLTDEMLNGARRLIEKALQGGRHG